MTDFNKNFHEIALKSVLFKGHNDWYFCFLKSEKIAHVLALLAAQTPLKDKEKLEELVSIATRLPHTIVHFVAGEADAAMVLADLFSTLSLVRLSATQGLVSKENAFVIAEEYELIVRKIAAQSHPSPFVASEDFAVQEVDSEQGSRPLLSAADVFPLTQPQGMSTIKDTDKGHKGHMQTKGHVDKKSESRMSLILDFVRKNSDVSIKEIARAVRGCSEKTIQRELLQLIKRGLVERRGERRWSTYRALPATP